MRKNLLGQKFGRLTVIEFSHVSKTHAFWKCKCDCGNEKIVGSHNLRTNSYGYSTKSCGCLQRERPKTEEWKKRHAQQSFDSYYRHHDENKLRKRSERMRRLYGMTPEEYDRMFREQDGRCYICGMHQSKLAKPLYIDHNHKTGEVRRLLCVKCNAGIGNFKESKELLEKAISYLKEFNGS